VCVCVCVCVVLCGTQCILKLCQPPVLNCMQYGKTRRGGPRIFCHMLVQGCRNYWRWGRGMEENSRHAKDWICDHSFVVPLISKWVTRVYTYHEYLTGGEACAQMSYGIRLTVEHVDQNVEMVVRNCLRESNLQIKQPRFIAWWLASPWWNCRSTLVVRLLTSCNFLRLSRHGKWCQLWSCQSIFEWRDHWLLANLMRFSTDDSKSKSRSAIVHGLWDPPTCVCITVVHVDCTYSGGGTMIAFLTVRDFI